MGSARFKLIHTCTDSSLGCKGLFGSATGVDGGGRGSGSWKLFQNMIFWETVSLFWPIIPGPSLVHLSASSAPNFCCCSLRCRRLRPLPPQPWVLLTRKEEFENISEPKDLREGTRRLLRHKTVRAALCNDIVFLLSTPPC